MQAKNPWGQHSELGDNDDKQRKRSIVSETNGEREDDKVNAAASATEEATCRGDFGGDDDGKQMKRSNMPETGNSEFDNDKTLNGSDTEEKEKEEEDDRNDDDDQEDDLRKQDDDEIEWDDSVLVIC